MLTSATQTDSMPGSPESNPLVQSCYPGDTGALREDTRRVLVHLLRGPSLDSTRHAILWKTLLRDREVLASRLSELFLELVVDVHQGVAFSRQVTSETLDVPVLLRKHSLSFLESVLVLHLRQRMTQADTQGERAVVDLQDMLEHLKVFEHSTNTDESKFNRSCSNAVERMKKLGLLHKLGSEERYEVSPTLKLLLSAEVVQALGREYASPTKSTGPVDTEDNLDESLA